MQLGQRLLFPKLALHIVCARTRTSHPCTPNTNQHTSHVPVAQNTKRLDEDNRVTSMPTSASLPIRNCFTIVAPTGTTSKSMPPSAVSSGVRNATTGSPRTALPVSSSFVRCDELPMRNSTSCWLRSAIVGVYSTCSKPRGHKTRIHPHAGLSHAPVLLPSLQAQHGHASG